jgi:hypothetical protein
LRPMLSRSNKFKADRAAAMRKRGRPVIFYHSIIAEEVKPTGARREPVRLQMRIVS